MSRRVSVLLPDLNLFGGLSADEVQQLAQQRAVQVDHLEPVATHQAGDEREERTYLIRLKHCARTKRRPFNFISSF